MANYIDLFAGCGGLSLGLKNAGWNGIFAIEKNKDAFETLRYNLLTNSSHFNWPDWLPKTNHDIYDVLENYEEQLKQLQGTVDLVAGGPPCQGFSLAGKRIETDKRNNLVHAYIEFVKLGLEYLDEIKKYCDTLQVKKIDVAPKVIGKIDLPQDNKRRFKT